MRISLFKPQPTQESYVLARISTNICRLCENEAELLNSHVLPDFFVRQLEFPETRGPGQQQRHVIVASISGKNKGVDTYQRGSWERGEGFIERLFCKHCESLLSKWETYARNALYGNSPPPSKKKIIGELLHYLGPPQKHFFRMGHLNYAEFKLFQLSMLFRASVAKGPMFQQVSLGEKHTSIIRSMLLNENPGHQLDYPCCLTSYEDAEGGLEDICCAPRRGKDPQIGTWYEFVMGGYSWLYYVSSQPKPAGANHAIKENGELVISVISGQQFIDRMIFNLEKMDPEWMSKRP